MSNKQLEALAILERVGRLLFEDGYEEPPTWSKRLAKALGVQPESLRSWRRGNAPFDASHGALDDLLKIAERKAADAIEARDELREWIRRNR
jgi:transposase-like protein